MGQRRLDLLLLLDPTLDLADTLQDLHHHDLVDAHKTGSRYGLINLMGLPLDADRFLDDAVTEGYADFSSMVDDIRRLQCRILFLQSPSACRVLPTPAVKDEALIRRIIEIVGDRAGAVSLPYPISGEEGLSERGRETCDVLTAQCKDILAARGTRFHPGQQVNPQELLAQSRHELEQLRLQPRSIKSRQLDLWTSYTRYADALSRIPSYYQHSNDLYQTIHPFRSSQNLLDLGCGDYGFARLWLLNEFYRASSRPFTERFHMGYVGADMQWEVVQSARHAFTTAEKHTNMLSSGMPAGPPPVSSRWVASNEDSFPFGNEFFDCIVCHFLLNFTGNPVVTLREVYRLLRPNGTLIMSCFTPSTNLATVYQTHLHETQQDGLSSMHRDLLLHLAHLHESIRSRRLHSFTNQLLATLVSQVTAQPARIFSSLGGHVLIATVKKPDSAR